MPIKQLIKIALRSLRANKLRSFLTMLGVIIGTASVILLLSLGTGLKTFIISELETLGSNLVLVFPGQINLKKMSPQGEIKFIGGMASSKLKLKDAKEIQKKVPEVKETTAVLLLNSTVKAKRKEIATTILGTTANYLRVRHLSLADGFFFSPTDVKGGKRVAVLGAQIAQNLFGETKAIKKRITLGEFRYTVVGVFQKQGAYGMMSVDEMVVIPITTAQRQFDFDNVSLLYAQIVTTDQVNPALAKIEAVLAKRLKKDEFTVLNQKDILTTVSSILSVLTSVLGGIAAISLLVGGIGIMNIMLVSVTERTREIGLRKAVGATPKLIMTQFLIEAVILALGGGVIGLFLALLLSWILSFFLPVTVTFWSLLLSFLVSGGVGVIFGLMPAKKAAQLDPIEALRYE